MSKSVGFKIVTISFHLDRVAKFATVCSPLSIAPPSSKIFFKCLLIGSHYAWDTKTTHAIAFCDSQPDLILDDRH